MGHDPILEEIYAIRETISRVSGDDIRKMADGLCLAVSAVRRRLEAAATSIDRRAARCDRACRSPHQHAAVGDGGTGERHLAERVPAEH